jgi:hypothetical protein
VPPSRTRRLEDTDRPDLFSSFEEMMEANRVEMPAMNRGLEPRSQDSGTSNLLVVG